MKNFIVAISVVLLGILLGGCSFNNKQAAKESSLKEQNSLLKENSSLKAKQKSSEEENSIASENNSSTQPSTSTSSNDSKKITSVNNADEAVQLAKQTYGDNGGDWTWGYMKDEDGNPSMIDGGYFVKAISHSMDPNGSQTAKSIVVYPDGTIKENL